MENRRTAIIVLNRNLRDETDHLCEQLELDANGQADIFVVESGSDPEKRSRFGTWWSNGIEATANGLRYARGFNYGLLNLYNEGRFGDYEFFFLVCNDIEFSGPVLSALTAEMDKHPRLGILSPCNRDWGELAMMRERETVYVWHANHIAWLLRRSFIESLMCVDEPDETNFLYDGSNFRGYLVDIELAVKGYANDWATGLTRRVMFRERTELLRTKAGEMQTTPFDQNLRESVEEGKAWLKRKYGFTSRWQMQQYAKLFYDEFFRLNPDLRDNRLFDEDLQLTGTTR